MMLQLALLGAVTLLGQVVLLREMTVACFGSELIILLGMGLWLLGSGLGAAFAPSGRPPAADRQAALWVVLAALLAGMIVLARGSRILAGGLPGAFLPLSGQLAILAIVLLPCSFLGGLIFQRAARLAVAGGRSLAAAYAAECAGALVGGAATTGLLAAGVGNLAQGLACALAAALAGLRVGRAGRPGGMRPATLAGGVLGGILLVALAFGPGLDRRLTAWTHPDLIRTADTPYGRITAEERQGQISLFINDALAFENQGTAAEEFVLPAGLQCAETRRVLVLGGALSGLLAPARDLRPDTLICVEMDPIVAGLLTDLGLDLWADGPGPTPRIVIGDPRGYLDTARDFDLILVGMPEPVSGRDNRYYTREFFAACARSLAPGGVLAFRVPTSANVRTPALARRAGSIGRALGEVFPSVVILPGSFDLFLASGRDLPRTADLPVARLQRRGLMPRLVTGPYLRYLYANDRFAAAESLLARNDIPANTDARPVCYRHTLVRWLSRFRPELGWRQTAAFTAGDLLRRPALWLALLAWVAVAWAARRRRLPGRALAMGAAGAAGLVLESVLLLDYQVRVGALYQDLGLLLCLFMLGMSAGAAAVAWLDARPGPRRSGGLWLPAALPTVGLAVAALVGRGALDTLPETGLALAATAAVVGAFFGSLGGTEPVTRDRLAPVLLGADLLGSGLGCLAAGVLLIPFWGLPGAALAAAATGLMALLPAAALALTARSTARPSP